MRIDVKFGLAVLLVFSQVFTFSLRLHAATVTWVGGNGDWATVTNWNTGALPGTNDDAVINPSGGPFTITHSTGAHTVHSVTSQQAFTLSGGTLTVSGTVQVNAAFTFSGGTLAAATVLQPTNASSLIINGNIGGTFSNVTVNGTLDVGYSHNSANLLVTNGLTLNGTALVGNPTNGWYGAMTFGGSQTLAGSGTVVFGDAGLGNGLPASLLRLSTAGTTLTIGPGITITGQNGTIGYSTYWGGPLPVSVVNLGTIQPTNGGQLGFNGGLTNQGVINITNGTVYLGSALSFATTNLGHFNCSNSPVYLMGTNINTGSTLSLNALGGTWYMDGGYILGGTVMATNGASLAAYAGGTLDGVTYDGTLDVGKSFNNVAIVATNGLTLNGTALVGNPTNGWYGAITFGGSQTLGGTGTVQFGNAGIGSGLPANILRPSLAGTTLSIGPGITIAGMNGTLGYSPYWGGSPVVGVVNLGAIQNVSGGLFGFNGGLTNEGIIAVTNGTVYFGAALTFATANLGAYNASNSSVYLFGTNINSSSVLSINALGGVLYMDGGYILGGNVIATNGASLVAYNSGTLDGVAFSGTLDVGKSFNNVAITITNSLTLNGTALVGNPTNGWYGGISFAGSQMLGGLGTVLFGDAGNGSGYPANILRLSIAGTTLTIGPGITIAGQNGTIGYSPFWGGSTNVYLLNQGSVSPSISGGTIAFTGSGLNNQGLLSSPANTVLDVFCTFTNNGTFNAINSGVAFGGTVTLANLGNFNATNVNVALTGMLINTNSTLSINSLGGAWILNGGYILGGVVAATNGASLIVSNAGGTLDGVTLNGVLDVGRTFNNVGITVTNGLTLTNATLLVGNPTNGFYGGMTFGGSQLLGGSGSVVFGNAGFQYSLPENILRLGVAGTTLTLGTGITVTGQNGTLGYSPFWGGSTNLAIIVQGVVSDSSSNGTISITGASLLSTGSLSTGGDGTLNLASGTFTNQGVLSVLEGYVLLNSGFAYSSGLINVSANAATNCGLLQCSGIMNLGGPLNFTWQNGYVPASGTTFTIATYSAGLGVFSPINLPPSPAWQVFYGGTNLTLTVSDIARLVFTSPPLGSSAGRSLVPVVVQVFDSISGNPVATSGVPVTMSLAAGSGILSGTLTQLTDGTGKATFSDLSFNIVGQKTLTANAVSAGFTPATSGPFTITFGDPSQLSVLTPFAATQLSGVAFSPPAILQVLDQFGNVASNFTETVYANASGGGGTLAGTVSVPGNGTNGLVTFGNLTFNLAGSNAVGNPTVYFTSFGLTPATNSPMTVGFAYTNINLTNGNSLVQINPTSQQGFYTWAVDGVDQLYQKWFWLRQNSANSQTSFDALAPALAFSTPTPASAVMTYRPAGLNINLGVMLAGGTAGSQQSTLVENFSVQNTNTSPVTLHLFEYSDFDLAGQMSGDTLTYPATNSVMQTGKGMILTDTIQGGQPDYWEASWYAITLDKLIGTGAVTLSDQFLPNSPGDQTFTYEWDFTLAAGQTYSYSETNVFQPAQPPISLTAANAGGFLVVSWPTNNPAPMQLYSSTNLGPQAVWSPVLQYTNVLEGQYQVTVPFTSQSQFFRLQP